MKQLDCIDTLSASLLLDGNLASHRLAVAGLVVASGGLRSFLLPLTTLPGAAIAECTSAWDVATTRAANLGRQVCRVNELVQGLLVVVTCDVDLCHGVDRQPGLDIAPDGGEEPRRVDDLYTPTQLGEVGIQDAQELLQLIFELQRGEQR